MKLACDYLLAVAVLGCLAHAQRTTQQPQQSQQPQTSKFQPPPTPTTAASTPPQQNTPQQSKQPPQCEVAENSKIECGLPGISASECEAIACCFDGRQCYYGKAVTLQCTTKGQFIIVVARNAILPNIDLESLSFYGNDPICSPVKNDSAFAIYQFPFTACGTAITEESGVVNYKNNVSSSFEVDIGQDSKDGWQLLFQCRYTGTSIKAQVIEIGLPPPSPPVALSAELRLANGQCNVTGCVEEDVAYSSFYTDSDYPVTKVLREPVYIEVRILERTDPNIVLTLGRCWATASPYPQSLPQWDLLVDGCPYRDDRYLSSLVNVTSSSGLQYPTHHRRFIFKMLSFVGTGKGGEAGEPLKEQVYIHCNTAVCQPSLGNNCEPRCFRQRADVAALVQWTRPESTVVSSQEIVFSDTVSQ